MPGIPPGVGMLKIGGMTAFGKVLGGPPMAGSVSSPDFPFADIRSCRARTDERKFWPTSKLSAPSI